MTLGAATLTSENECSTRTLCASSSDSYVKAKSCCESWESAVVVQLQSDFFPADDPAETAPQDTTHFVTLEVTMPYTKAEFDDSKQAAYKVCCCVDAMSRISWSYHCRRCVFVLLAACLSAVIRLLRMLTLHLVSQAAMAATAGTVPSNVDILQVTEERRRAGSIIVDTKVVSPLIPVGRECGRR